MEGFDFQLFAPAEVRYNGQPDRKEGIFFSYDALIWSISRPQTALIGSAETHTVYGTTTMVEAPVTYTWTYDTVVGSTIVTHTGSDTQPPWSITHYYYHPFSQSSSQSTSPFGAPFTAGNRYQFGWMGPENGWAGEVFTMQSQHQTFAASDVTMTFHDPSNKLAGIAPDQDPPGSHVDGYVYPIPGSSWYYPHYSAPTYTPVPATGLPAGYDVRALPINFAQMTVQNVTDLWGTELMYVRRFQTSEHWGTFELLLGARYAEFNEGYYVRTNNSYDVAGTPITDPTTQVLPRGEATLSNSAWNTDASNHIVGPQIGGHWYKQWGRLRFSAEGRFCAGLNQQDVHQEAVLGTLVTNSGVTRNSSTSTTSGQVGGTNFSFSSTTPNSLTNANFNVPAGMQSMYYSSDAHMTEFTPVVDLRLELNYQVTRAIYAKVGWTGMWMDHVARPSGMVNYDIDTMGIVKANNWQSVLVNGFNVGVVVNR